MKTIKTESSLVTNAKKKKKFGVGMFY